MLIRNKYGELVEINKYNYKNDIIYYNIIMSHLNIDKSKERESKERESKESESKERESKDDKCKKLYTNEIIDNIFYVHFI
jgi:hypothetical protein